MVLGRLKEEVAPDDKQVLENINKTIEENAAKAQKMKNINKSYGITVKGLSNIMIRFAKCCNPVPGDDIIGYITKGRGVSVHRKDCLNVKELEDNEETRIVEVSWGVSKGTAYTAELQVEAEDRMGLLAEVMLILSEAKISVNAVNAKTLKGNLTVTNIKIKIDSIDQLKDLMKKLRKLKGVLDVYRMNN